LTGKKRIRSFKDRQAEKSRKAKASSRTDLKRMSMHDIEAQASHQAHVKEGRERPSRIAGLTPLALPGGPRVATSAAILERNMMFAGGKGDFLPASSANTQTRNLDDAMKNGEACYEVVIVGNNRCRYGRRYYRGTIK
jgi:hypothetical protein